MYSDYYDSYDGYPYFGTTPATEVDIVLIIWVFSFFIALYAAWLLDRFAKKESLKGAVTPKSATKIGNAMSELGVIVFVVLSIVSWLSENNVFLFFSGPIATILIGYGQYMLSFRKSKSSCKQKATKILAHALVITSFSAIVFQMYTYIFWDNPVFNWAYLIITIIVLIYLANRAFRKSYAKL